ncbi:MAG TPA: phosphotransferase [Syntrophorhabdaceae bacterium]|nr:phosphotransferase [Syntrophorhabdaceae bacterium]
MTSQEELLSFVCSCLRISESTAMVFESLPVRGSDRAFFRISWGDSSAILIRYDQRREENNYYADIALFLKDIGVSVPTVHGHDRVKGLLLFEDLGRCDLFSCRHTGPGQLSAVYKNTLAEIHLLHCFPIEKIPSAVCLMEGFSTALYGWEHDYFRLNFVQGLAGVPLNGPRFEMLQKEFSELAGHLLRTTTCLVHRDLQSQNVMLRQNRPYFIDFQGMRLGSAFYDLGSLLNDPYMMLSEDTVLLLLRFYYDLSERDVPWPRFVDLFWEASIQRLLQALGAYAFLSRNKGLDSFLEHIPAGLSRLRTALTHVPWLRTLSHVVSECSDAVTNPQSATD